MGRTVHVVSGPLGAERPEIDGWLKPVHTRMGMEMVAQRAKEARARNHGIQGGVIEKLDSEYPTNEQIKETLAAFRKGGDFLMELIRNRRAAESDDGQPNEKADGPPPDA